MPKLRFGVVYDFRNPASSGFTHATLYGAVLDQIAWLDECGLDLAWFTEHHFVDDGYLPSWIPVATAAAARTKRTRFSADICLLPFNNPVRLAEDLAILDNISNGRAEIGIGMGYANHEFHGFAVPKSRRVSLTDEGLEVLKLCFSGERFSYKGKRYEFNDVRITPEYVQPGGPPLWIAAMSEPGAHRAARFKANLLPQGPRDEVLDPWRKDLTNANETLSDYRVGIIKSVLVTDDPERDWAPVREAERYRMRSYASFSNDSRHSPDQVQATYANPNLIPQTWIVGDVQTCVDALVEFIATFGVTDIVTWALPPGFHPERMNDSLSRLFNEVVPLVRARLNTTN
jgi:alkanesulfonate monooxygenase SsuD/methylene tetrahydromethanopterin reductase-like flavin-dependent oxidoreductase (luciferase family)